MSDTGTDTEGDNEAGRSNRSSRFKQIASKLNEEDQTDSESNGRDRSDSESDEPAPDPNEEVSDHRRDPQDDEREAVVEGETEPGVGSEPKHRTTSEHHAVPDRIEPGAGDRDRTADQDDAASTDDTNDPWEWVSVDDESDEDTEPADDGSNPSTESTPTVIDPGTKDKQKQNDPGSDPSDTPVGTDEGAGSYPTGRDETERGETLPPAGESTTSKTETGTTPDGDENQSETASKSRLWNRDDSDRDKDRDKRASTSSRPSGSATVEDATLDAPTGEARDSREGGQLADRQFTPGTNVLVQSGSQDDRTHDVCQDLLYSGASDPYALLVRYRKMDPERLGQIASHTHHTKVIAVGYSQPTPASEDANVECVQINSPNDITRLGILVSGTLDDWADDDRDITFCYDSLNVLLNYRDVKSTFRFLHVFLSTLDQAEAIGHFHVDSVGGNPQDISTLKPLFDEIVSIDSVGIHLE